MPCRLQCASHISLPQTFSTQPRDFYAFTFYHHNAKRFQKVPHAAISLGHALNVARPQSHRDLVLHKEIYSLYLQ